MPSSPIEWAAFVLLLAGEGWLLYLVLWRWGLTRSVEALAWFFRRLAHGPEPRTLPPMGIRPNQPRRLVAAPPRCRHSNPPVPVHVRDTLDGHAEVVRWLCPDCTEETHGPPPTGRGSVSLGGISAAEAAANLQRSLRRTR